MDKNRRTVYEVLLSMEANGAYSNIALNEAVRRFRPQDEAFVRNLVYGVVENQIYLDYKLSKFVKSELKKVRPQALVLLRMGAYQMEFMGSVPDYAAIDESVRIAKKVCRGLEGFINGVLRSYQRLAAQVELPSRETDLKKWMSVRYSCTEDIADNWLRMFGAKEAERLLVVSNSVPPLTVRVNRLKTDAESLSRRLRSEGFSAEVIMDGKALRVGGSGVISSGAEREGLFSVQDVSSMMMVSALALQPGETVIDICAAPGGKTMAAAEQMKNSGRVIACDIYHHKLELIERTARRLGITIVETVRNDGRVFRPEFEGMGDCVIVDAPCSGLGVIRRRPEIKLRMMRADMKALARLQAEILETSARYVKPGGRLVYSTCTVSDIENGDVTENFLKKNNHFLLEKQSQLLPEQNGPDGFYFSVFRRL